MFISNGCYFQFIFNLFSKKLASSKFLLHLYIIERDNKTIQNNKINNHGL